MFLIGTYTVIVEPSEINATSSLTYEESGTHRPKCSIRIEGRIKPLRATELLINGEQSIEHLPIRLLLVADAPLVWDNASQRKTIAEPDGLATDTVAESLGQFRFIPAYQDRELDIKEDDSIWVDVNLPDSLFGDLWAWVRSSCEFRGLSFDVYGETMQRVPDFVGTTYHWKCDDRTCLHVTNFGYSFGQIVKRDNVER